jgi:hypothetical protein
MTAMDEKLVLDADGIPILTELVRDGDIPVETGKQQDAISPEASPADIADRLLKSKTFQQQLDEITAELTQSMRSRVEQSLRPAIEEATSLALDDSDTHTTEAVRQQLESALPALITRALEK